METRSGQVVIVPTFHAAGQGSIPVRIEMLGSVSVNHSLIITRCKNGTSKWDDLMHPFPWDCIKAAHAPDHLKVMVHTKAG